MKFTKSANAYLLLLSFFLFPSVLFGVNPTAELKKVTSFRNDQTHYTELKFGQPTKDLKVEIEYINRTIQVSIPQANYILGKSHQRIVDPFVQSIYTYQLKSGGIRCRIILKKNLTANRFKGLVEVNRKGNSLFVHLNNKLSDKPKNLALSKPPKGLTEKSKKFQEELIKEFEVVPEPVVAQILPAKESDIPLTLGKIEQQADSESSIQYLVSAVAVFLVFLITALVLLKWWMGRSKVKNTNTKISILTQYHLGSKKSLAIVRVAGESILIGVTDHNISMIKSLSLLDEEIPAIDSKPFDKAMASADASNESSSGSMPTDSLDDFAMKDIKDIVTSRLKGMKEFR